MFADVGRIAALGALRLSREAARQHALRFSWQHVAKVFLSHLAPIGAERLEKAALRAGGAEQAQ